MHVEDHVITTWLVVAQPLVTLSETMVAHLVSRMEAWDNRNTQVGDLFLHMVKNSYI